MAKSSTYKQNSLQPAVLLLSGGLDSSAQICLAKEHGYCIEFALTLDYGQRAAAAEIRAAGALCERFGIKHEIIDFPFFRDVMAESCGGLLNRDKNLDLLSGQHLDHHEKALASAKKVWIPNRNGIFMALASAFAEAHGIDSVMLGFNSEEAQTFPDNSQGFLDASEKALGFSTANRLKPVSLTTHLDKTQIVTALRKRDFPLHLIWSCYDAPQGSGKTCGVCESCKRLERACRMSSEQSGQNTQADQAAKSDSDVASILMVGLQGLSSRSLNVLPLANPVTYTGTELRPHWILERTGVYGSGVVVFAGSCQVDTGHLVDLEDRLKSDWIAAKAMLHFVAEFFPPVIPANQLELAVYYQRLLVIHMERVLSKMLDANKVFTVSRSGDDLYIHSVASAKNGSSDDESARKLSVSIATTGAVSSLIHWGINLNETGAPSHVHAAGLMSTLGFTALDVLFFAKASLEGYIQELEEIKIAQCKVQPRI